MKEVSKIASNVQASTTLTVDALFKKMKADGLDVVGFGAGEPDFDTPGNIKEAAHKAIRDGHTSIHIRAECQSFANLLRSD